MGPWPKRCLGVLIAATMLCGNAALSEAPPPPMSRATRFLMVMMRNDVTREAYMKEAAQRFLQVDVDGDERITRADDDANALMFVAGYRAGMMLSILNADLDGDGIVTSDELRRSFVYQRRGNPKSSANAINSPTQIEASVVELMKADTDGDGRITHAEMLAWANGRIQQMKASGLLTSHNFDQVSSFDSDRDGAVTRQEFDAAHQAFFRAIDTDDNGTISAEELKNYRDRIAEKQN